MIGIQNKDVVGLRIKSKVIVMVRHGATLVWQAIRSCFGNGAWFGEKPWIGEDGWKG